MSMETKVKKEISTLTVKKATQKKAKTFCNKKGYKMQTFVEAAIANAIANDLTL